MCNTIFIIFAVVLALGILYAVYVAGPYPIEQLKKYSPDEYLEEFGDDV
jgi:hypothetical protein